MCRRGGRQTGLARMIRYLPEILLMRIANLSLCIALLVASLALVGCNRYQVRGKAIEGPMPAVVVVSKNDPRLDRPGVAGAVIQLTLDPQQLNARRVGADVTDMDGSFAIDVEDFGAGLLEYDAGVAARLTGYQPSIDNLRLPQIGQRLLVIMAPGEEGAAPPQESVLEETMRITEPLR